MLMRSDLLMNNIRNNSVDLLKVQNQLTTGLKLARPSDAPAEATTIMHLDSLLESQKQYARNIDFTLDYLSATDNALGQAVELANDAYTIALGSIGTATDDAGRASNALIIDQILEQLVNIGNYTARGSYIFGGQNATQTPFESYQGGVRFNGDLSPLQSRVARTNLLDFNISGDDAFGALSSQVIGFADLDPDITTDTLLSDLNGALGQGIRLGSIVISDGTNTDTVDLSDAVTVGDVIRKINDQTASTTTAAIASDGTSLTITSTLSGADLSVREVGSGSTAHDLGIYQSSAGATLNGQDVDARLSLTTPVTALAGGAGIDLNSGLRISNSLLAPIDPIDLSSAQTLGDILNAINSAEIGVRAEINDDANGINIFNQLSGSEMRIGENGGTTATDLGIRSFTGDTLLDDLNGGQGAGTGSSDAAITIHTRDGNDYTIDLSSARTVQDVIDAVNSGTGGHILASLAEYGNGIQLEDTIGGSDNLSVDENGQTGYMIAERLGLKKSVASDSLVGDDVNPIKPEGLFSHLIALRDALRMNGDAAARDRAISQAAEAIAAARENLRNRHGQVGAVMKAVQDRKTHMEDNILATETLRSDIRDIDFTEAITRYQNLYTALQGNLMTGSQLTSVSLLDFLR